MRGILTWAVVLMCGAGLAACGGGGKSKKSGSASSDSRSAFQQLKDTPAEVDAEVDKVLKPIDGVDSMLEQLKGAPTRLKINADDFSAVLNNALAGEAINIPETVQGKSRTELEVLIANVTGFRNDLLATPDRAQGLIGELAKRSVAVPKLATQASASAGAKAANPFSSAKEKAEAKQQQGEVKTIQKDAQDRIAAAQDKVKGVPGRAGTAIAKFIAGAGEMGITEEAIKAANRPVDDAKKAANQTVDTAKEGVNDTVDNAEKAATGK
ncbi:MAG: hypothetical protein KC620_04685 [Myxococcales bacterium]|nr:hypothetical protein [Myxococcales bacterium]